MSQPRPVHWGQEIRNREAPILLLAVAAAFAVANVYLSQPLLTEISRDLQIRPSLIGAVSLVTQAGYALGLLLLVPLGDLVDPKRLIVFQILGCAIALCGIALARSSAMLLCAFALTGALSAVVQLLVAFGAGISPPDQRGRVIGRITTGVVVGILLARVVSGLIAQLGGWRAVYSASALCLVILGMTLARTLSSPARPQHRQTYGALLLSTLRLVLGVPLLRIRAMFAVFIFATFATFWTTMALPLSAPPFDFSPSLIGSFGFVGVAGALAASRAGKRADRGLADRTTGMALVLLLLSWVPIAMLHLSVGMMVAGVLILDLAVQAVHVTNQSLLVNAMPDARNRLIALYMTAYSVGSGAGAIVSTVTFSAAGWAGVCALGAGFSALGLCFWLWTMRAHSPGVSDSCRSASS
jgi:predicted MFS family arabinose efflux permease